MDTLTRWLGHWFLASCVALVVTLVALGNADALPGQLGGIALVVGFFGGPLVWLVTFGWLEIRHARSARARDTRTQAGHGVGQQG